MRSYSWFLWSEITLYNTYYSYRNIQKCLWFIFISMICIEESFKTHSNITPFVEQVCCWIIYSYLLQFMEHTCFLIILFHHVW